MSEYSPSAIRALYGIRVVGNGVFRTFHPSFSMLGRWKSRRTKDKTRNTEYGRNAFAHIINGAGFPRVAHVTRHSHVDVELCF